MHIMSVGGLTTFAEITKQVHKINDLILSDMVCDTDDTADEIAVFSKHLLATKYWFARISHANKKRYLLTLLQSVHSAWTLSLILKSMWNCRLKDAVLSVSEPNRWLSSYDQAPMDHNRTALPEATLAQAMRNDRIWFLALDPESQALVLSELLTVAGGPTMWAVMQRARVLYDRHQERMMQNIQECSVLPPTLASDVGTSKGTSAAVGASAATSASPTELTGPMLQKQKELDAHLATWNATIKSLKDHLKLEELEMTFTDGTKRRIWKVNRPKPDIMETVDFVQLLPSSVGKLILSYLPRAQLADYARVNKYWAYLVDEYRAELAARIKINTDFTRLNDILLKHDDLFDEYVQRIEQPPASEPAGQLPTTHVNHPIMRSLHSVRPSERSAAAYSLRQICDKLAKPAVAQKPIRNLAEITERLEKRGAADENIWQWCENIIKQTLKQNRPKMKKETKKAKNHAKQEGVAFVCIFLNEIFQKDLLKKPNDDEGVLLLGNVHFPCPLMKLTLVVPLKKPLYKDPATVSNSLTPKQSRRQSECTIRLARLPERIRATRFTAWTRDLSSLYPVSKIPSYMQLPKKDF